MFLPFGWLPLALVFVVGWLGSRERARRWLVRDPMPPRLVSACCILLLVLGFVAILKQVPAHAGDNAWLIVVLPAWLFAVVAVGLVIAAAVPGDHRRRKATGGALAVMLVFGVGTVAMLGLWAALGNDTDLEGNPWKGPVWRMTIITAVVIIAILGVHRLPLPHISLGAGSPRHSAR